VASIVPEDLIDRIGRELYRLKVRARNGLRQLGGVAAGPVAVTPKTPVWRRDGVVLYRYESTSRAFETPILLVMSLVTKPYVFDLRPDSSLVADLLAAGFDVYLLDWGTPGPADAHNGMETYCDEYLPRAVGAAVRTSGASGITVLGYCVGALLSLLAFAANPDLPIRSLVLMATPVDLRELGPMATLLREGRLAPQDLLDETGNVPPSVILEFFRMVQPTAPLTTYASLWDNLADEEALAAHNVLISWSTDHIPFPGRAFVQMVELFLHRGALLAGKVPLGDRVARLDTITCPVLSVTGTRDTLVPAAASEPLTRLLPAAHVTTLDLPAGHVGLFVGRSARKKCVPAVVGWLAEAN
jgi:polyhydroxyalkanoate synthase